MNGKQGVRRVKGRESAEQEQEWVAEEVRPLLEALLACSAESEGKRQRRRAQWVDARVGCEGQGVDVRSESGCSGGGRHSGDEAECGEVGVGVSVVASRFVSQRQSDLTYSAQWHVATCSLATHAC